MLITNGAIIQPGVRRRTIQRQVSLGPISLRIVTIVIFAAAALALVAQQADATTKVYHKKDLDGQITAESDKVNLMKGEITRLESLQNITAKESTGQSVTPTAAPEAVQLEESKTINALPTNEATQLVSSTDL